MRRLLALVITALAVAALGYGSRAPYTASGADQSVLRLSWRLRGEKLETCRDRSAAELAALPVHMRVPRICTGHLVSYRLILTVDGKPDTLIFAPAGAKADRPIFVLHDQVVSPGVRDVAVEFAPIGPAGEGKALRYRAVVDAQRGRIQLITLTPDASRLVLLD